MVLGSNPVAVISPSDFAPASSKEFLDIQATIECGFTLKRVRDMTRTYSHNMHVLDFSTELQNPEVSVTLLKSDSTTDALQPILNFSKQKKETFSNCYKWVD